MCNGDSVARDFLRHIRNSVAHGKCDIRQKKGRLVFVGRDYKDSDGNDQSAYICLSVEALQGVYKLYCDIERSIERNR